MHQSSFENVIRFRDEFMEELRTKKLSILDIGSMDVNGSYREIFNDSSWCYVGADVTPGKNVDVILNNPYRWNSITTESVDVLVSGQAFEHIEYFWLTMLEITRVLRTGGICCLIAPSGGFEHRYPVDCWRFYPDGFKALARFAGLTPLRCSCRQTSGDYTDDSDLWKDTVLVARKPAEKIFRKWRRRLLHRMIRMIS